MSACNSTATISKSTHRAIAEKLAALATCVSRVTQIDTGPVPPVSAVAVGNALRRAVDAAVDRVAVFLTAGDEGASSAVTDRDAFVRASAKAWDLDWRKPLSEGRDRRCDEGESDEDRSCHFDAGYGLIDRI